MIKQLSGIPVEITVKNNLRSVRLTVTQKSKVKLSVPQGYPLEAAWTFVLSKQKWIEKCLEKHKKAPVFEIKNGAVLPIVGQTLRIEHIPGRIQSVCERSGCLMVTSAESSFVKTAENFISEKLLTYITQRAAYYSHLTGLCFAEISISRMRSKWGQCNIDKRSMKFSLNLAFMPTDAVDYVVLHEIAHLRYARHDKSFYGYIARFMPDYKRRIKLLNP